MHRYVKNLVMRISPYSCLEESGNCNHGSKEKASEASFAMGNGIIERFVFTNIEKELKNEITEDLDFVSCKKSEKLVDNDSLRTWIEELHKNRTNYQKAGCIVMNCNPFTKGHYYLIDQGRKEVENLYIFVVEEDQSEFSFAERYEMVVNNCAHWDNMKVIPSTKRYSQEDGVKGIRSWT